MRHTPRHHLALLVLLAATPAACGYRPARFADAPAVAEVADDAPIPVPERLDPMKELHAVEAYVHRPLALALDPARPPTAGDVNAMDEVPRSSWFDPRGEGRDREDGPPILPLVVITAEPESGQGGLAVIDARRIRYEIARGPAERPEIRSAGAAITSRLLNAVGWRAPEVHVVTIARADLQTSTAEASAAADTFMQNAPVLGGATGGRAGEAPLSAVHRTRVRALRWPIGIDVGPTPVTGTRDGDPNDRVPHTERRTLRALKLALFWVGSTRLDRNALRDAYLGMPGKGYLMHWIVGLDDALGVNAIYDEPNARLGGEGRYLDANALTALVTLGLKLRHPPPLQTRWPALGDFDERASPESFGPSPPFEPIDRILPADAYWAAKRIAAVPGDVVARAVVAAKMSDAGSAARAIEVLLARRASILASGLRQVTPAEVEGTTASHLVLRDEAIGRGVEPATKTEYAIEYLDSDGVEAAPPRRIAPHGASIDVPLPAPGPDYLVVRALAVRRGRPAPRACEVHLVRDHGGARVVGVRH
jgi:hypothetical protein